MKFTSVLVGLVLLLSIPTVSAEQTRSEAQQAFFDRLLSLCRATFTGAAVYPEEPGEDWKDQLLVAELTACDAREVRIPLAVGEDRTRTWIIRPVNGGLELKHDHRHADGTPDEVTNYGGVTQRSGTALAQSFPADEATDGMIPEAATNEWFLSFSEDGRELTYYLERHGKPRFKAVLTRK